MVKKRTKPPHAPVEEDRERVELLAGFGLPHTDIALIVGISGPTLRKYYGHELKLGKTKANAQVAKTLFQQATNKEKPNISACIFWLKCQAGWREAGSENKGKKEQQQEAATEVARGKFSAGAPPLALKVVR